MEMNVKEAGRLGGLKVLHTKGREFYSEIGKKGQKAMRAQYPDMAKEWGRKGGRPKKGPNK
jgi:general stress protein YciG